MCVYNQKQLSRLLYLWNSPGKNTGVGSHSVLQCVFLTQGSNLGLLHWQVDFFFLLLSHKGSPSIWITKLTPFLSCYLQHYSTSYSCSHRDLNTTYRLINPKIASPNSLSALCLAFLLPCVLWITYLYHLTQWHQTQESDLVPFLPSLYINPSASPTCAEPIHLSVSTVTRLRALHLLPRIIY